MKIRFSRFNGLHVDEIFPLLVVLLVGNIGERDDDQQSNEARHEDAEIVNFLVDVVVGATWTRGGRQLKFISLAELSRK